MTIVAQQGESMMSTSEAFEQMCISSMKVSGMVKGLRQVTKTLITGEAKLIIMAETIDNKKMEDLIEAFVREKNVPMLKVKTHNELARYVGICKTDETGKIVKEAKCSVASIKDFGDSTLGRDILFSKIGLVQE